MELSSIYSVRSICQTLDINRSTVYYRQQMDEYELELRDRIEQIAAEYPRYVYRRTAEMLRKEFIYLAVLMDVFTRSVKGWNLSRSLDDQLTLGALDMALCRGKPEIHHSDQGVQYLSGAYVGRLDEYGIRISLASRGAAWENGYAERLIRTLKEEEVYLHEYDDFYDAHSHIGHFLNEVYMKKRPHSSLAYRTPVEFEAEFRDGVLLK